MDMTGWRGWLSIAILGTCVHAEEPALRLKIEAKVGTADFRSGPVHAIQGTPIWFRVSGAGDEGTLRWFQIVPDTARYYKNANHPWEAEPYEWVGFGKIEYQCIEIEAWRGREEVELGSADVFHRASPSPYYNEELGSFWLQVEALSGMKRLRSAGLQENDVYNLSPEVFRLSIQKDRSYLGYLTGFFNVPGLFGSIPYQSHHYIGVDCADVLVAANQRWRGLEEGKDSNVSMLVSAWKAVVSFPIVGGMPKATIKWSDQVQPGDAIAVRYTPGKAFQHIGALYEDTNHNGVLDAPDEVIHAGPHALHLSRLREGGFDGEAVILRPPR